MAVEVFVNSGSWQLMVKRTELKDGLFLIWLFSKLG